MNEIELIRKWSRKPAIARKLIDWSGGPTPLGRHIGIAGKGASQRINNWSYNGIPVRAFIDHPSLMDEMRRMEQAEALEARRKARKAA